MLYTLRAHKGDKQAQMTWITRLELHCDSANCDCDAATSGVPILLRLVTPTPGGQDTGHMIQISDTYTMLQFIFSSTIRTQAKACYTWFTDTYTDTYRCHAANRYVHR